MDQEVLAIIFPALPIHTASFLTATAVAALVIFAFTLRRNPIQPPFKRWVRQMIQLLPLALELLRHLLRKMRLYMNRQRFLRRHSSLRRLRRQRPVTGAIDLEGGSTDSIGMTRIRGPALRTSH